MKARGSRAEVMHGKAKRTSGGLMKKDLKYNKQRRIVSRKMSLRAKKEKRLEKAGYKTKKGVFGSFKKGKRVSGRRSRRRSKRRSRRISRRRQQGGAHRRNIWGREHGTGIPYMFTKTLKSTPTEQQLKDQRQQYYRNVESRRQEKEEEKEKMGAMYKIDYKKNECISKCIEAADAARDKYYQGEGDRRCPGGVCSRLFSKIRGSPDEEYYQ